MPSTVHMVNKLFLFCNKIAPEFNILVYWIVRETSKSDWQTNLRHNWQFSIFLPQRKVCSPNKIKILPTKASSTNISDREKSCPTLPQKAYSFLFIHGNSIFFQANSLVVCPRNLIFWSRGNKFSALEKRLRQILEPFFKNSGSDQKPHEVNFKWFFFPNEKRNPQVSFC